MGSAEVGSTVQIEMHAPNLGVQSGCSVMPSAYFLTLFD